MLSAMPFVSVHRTDAKHGSMVAHIGHAAVRQGECPKLGSSFYQLDSDWFSRKERALAYL